MAPKWEIDLIKTTQLIGVRADWGRKAYIFINLFNWYIICIPQNAQNLSSWCILTNGYIYVIIANTPTSNQDIKQFITLRNFPYIPF